jgi:long-subunit fatty acid transport protein
MNYMSGVNMGTAGYTHVVNDKTTVGGSIQYINYGQLKQRDINNNDLGNFSPMDIVFEPMLSYTLAKNLVGGVGGKFIYSKLGDYTSTAAAIDLGLNYYDSDIDFSASIALKNLGGQLSAYNDEYENLPTDVMLGVTKGLGETMPFRISLTMSDLGHWNYSFLQHACIGVDLLLTPQFYIAGGYNLRRAHEMKVSDGSDGESSHGAGLSVGAGLSLERFNLDVSYGKYHVSSSSLMVNLGIKL